MDKTLFTGPIFYSLAIVIAILLFWWSARIVVAVVKATSQEDLGQGVLPEGLMAGTIIKLVLAWACYCILLVMAWNLKQGWVNSGSRERNHAEEQEIREALEHVPATDDELRTRKEGVRKVAEGEHDNALTGFEKAMKKEAEKIENRNKVPEKSEDN